MNHFLWAKTSWNLFKIVRVDNWTRASLKENNVNCVSSKLISMSPHPQYIRTRTKQVQNFIRFFRLYFQHDRIAGCGKNVRAEACIPNPFISNHLFSKHIKFRFIFLTVLQCFTCSPLQFLLTLPTKLTNIKTFSFFGKLKANNRSFWNCKVSTFPFCAATITWRTSAKMLKLILNFDPYFPSVSKYIYWCMVHHADELNHFDVMVLSIK